jgi:anaerobic ribonucleoside-triphosphate reductase activating protein
MTPAARPVRLSRLAYPVNVLGPGTRAVLWMQGCTIRCPGCMARDTWAAAGGRESSVHEIVDWVRRLPPDRLDGFTISGGEPSEQPAALAALLPSLRGVLPADSDLLVFTGRPAAWVQGEGSAIFVGADAVMAEPYQRELAGHLPLRGSDNQVLLPLTALGARRYVDEAIPDTRHQLEISVEDRELRLVGIPLPGVLDRFAATASETGLVLRGRSWH